MKDDTRDVFIVRLRGINDTHARHIHRCLSATNHDRFHGFRPGTLIISRVETTRNFDHSLNQKVTLSTFDAAPQAECMDACFVELFTKTSAVTIEDVRSKLDQQLLLIDAPTVDDVSLSRQIACVEREIMLRETMYPKWIASGKMLSEQARIELLSMRAVRETLLRRDRGE